MPLKEPESAFGITAGIVILLGTLIAMLGGVAKYLSDVQENKAVFTWVGISIQAFISAFTGTLVSLYLLEHEFSLYMILLGSGIAGFLGVVLLRLVASKVYQHFGQNPKQGEDK